MSTITKSGTSSHPNIVDTPGLPTLAEVLEATSMEAATTNHTLWANMRLAWDEIVWGRGGETVGKWAKGQKAYEAAARVLASYRAAEDEAWDQLAAEDEALGRLEVGLCC